jgi:hypothetical protein
MPKASKKCAVETCFRIPRFRNGSSGLIVCKFHSELGDENCTDARCIVRGCGGWCIYNYIGGRPLFCCKHRIANMANVRQAFRGLDCFILGCNNKCRSALPVCKEHTPQRVKHKKRHLVDPGDLLMVYEEQRSLYDKN